MIENNTSNSIKVYTQRQIHVGTFLGGPIAAGILLSKNYNSLGEPSTAKRTILISICFTIIFFLFFHLASSSFLDKVPEKLFPMIFLLIEYIIFYYFQKDKVQKHLSDGGAKESWWKTIGFSFLGLILFLIGIIITIFMEPAYQGKVITFGKAQSSIYYDSGIPQKDIIKIKNTLHEIGYFDTEVQIDIQARMEPGNAYHLYFPIAQQYWDSTETVKTYTELGMILESKLPGKKVKISFYSDKLPDTEYKRIR
jgi:hypothetical protein